MAFRFLRPLLALFLSLAAGAALAQVSLGILAVLLRLPIAVRASHAVVAYALWALMVWIAVRASGWGASPEAGAITYPLGSTIDPLGSPSASPRQTTAAPRQATAAPKHPMGPE